MIEHPMAVGVKVSATRVARSFLKIPATVNPQAGNKAHEPRSAHLSQPTNINNPSLRSVAFTYDNKRMQKIIRFKLLNMLILGGWL